MSIFIGGFLEFIWCIPKFQSSFVLYLCVFGLYLYCIVFVRCINHNNCRIFLGEISLSNHSTHRTSVHVSPRFFTFFPLKFWRANIPQTRAFFIACYCIIFATFFIFIFIPKFRVSYLFLGVGGPYLILRGFISWGEGCQTKILVLPSIGNDTMGQPAWDFPPPDQGALGASGTRHSSGLICPKRRCCIWSSNGTEVLSSSFYWKTFGFKGKSQ